MPRLRIKTTGDPKPSPEELAKANAVLKDIATRRGIVNAASLTVGNKLPRYIDSATGKDITNVPAAKYPQGTIMDIRQVPLSVTELQFDNKANLPYFLDDNGYIKYVHPDIAASSRFNPNRGKYKEDLIAKK